MDDSDVVIVSAVRTPIGTYGGVFRETRAPELSAPIMKEAVKRAGVEPGLIDDVIWGCCYQRTKDETNLARVAALKAQIPVEVPAFTVNRTCTSAMQAFISGTQAIRLGDASIILVGGTESMSTVPYTLDGIRWGVKMDHVELRDAMFDGLRVLGTGLGMGQTAEKLVEKYHLSRSEQDEIAYMSHMRASAAVDRGRFKDEILPFEIPRRKGQSVIVDTDEHPRPDTTIEKLAGLRPVFKEGGTVTAGNSSGMNDASAGIMLMRFSKAKELGVKPLARVVSYAVAGVHPDIMGIGPVPSTRKALEKANLTLDAIDLVEANEAFAAQYLAVEKELKLDREKTNVNGSAIGLGHPVGCAGVRLLVTLVHEMKKRGSGLGLATLCSGGGMGMSVIIGNVD